jgi:hypothetical protein
MRSMRSIVEREVTEQPQNDLASFRARISEVMADMDKEVVIPPVRSSGLRLWLFWRPVGISFNK